MDTVSKVGFGCYRVSSRSKTHYEALRLALDSGCSLIDTSANYTDGESEALIGKVLSEKAYDVCLMTKAGYIQGKNLDVVRKLNSEGKALEDLVKINDNLWHSIHPEFLENQIDLSLKRLGIDCIDVFFLHNPEYYFQEEGSSQSEYYQRIEKAFIFLEEMIKVGKIKSYGISSNTFVNNTNEPDVTNLEKILEIKDSIENCHFSHIQFPFNFIETNAMEKFYGNFSLIEKAKLCGLVTVVNRPLNGFRNNSLVRLATYDSHYEFVSEEESQKVFTQCKALIEAKWNEQEHDEDVFEIPVLKQFCGLWDTLSSQDAVEQVYYGHFFPLLARIWGEKGLDSYESQPFYDLFEISSALARQNMTKVANDFREQAVASGLLPSNSKNSLQYDCINKYLEMGIDHVLVGMKHPEYVRELSELF